MKKLMLLTVAIASISTLSLCAADDAAPKKAKKELSADVIKKYDKDGDGKLSKEEPRLHGRRDFGPAGRKAHPLAR
jgi:hypothetical protein